MTVDRWERRQLCEDGTCIGVIGAEGTCKTCGKPASDWGDLRKPGRVSSKSESDEPEPDAEVDAPEETEAKPTASPAKVAASASKVSAWNERKLCTDGTCIGLIGDDGKCKVCRKPADGSAAADEVEEEDADEAEGDDGEDAEDGEEDENDEDEDDDDEVAQDDETDDHEAEADEDDEDADAAAEDEADKAAAKNDKARAKAAKKADDDENRALCPDGACVGLIGDNGKCKVCGKAAA